MFYLNSPIIRWRKYNNNYFLEAAKCTACGKIYFPKSYKCSCGCESFSKIVLSGRGKIIALTQSYVATLMFTNQVPIIIALVELDEGVRILGQIVDVSFDILKIGMRVKSCFRKVYECGKSGIINYGIKFVLGS
ncbi:TPA: hypothetical protein DEO28_01180 [Candidatus Dependentiae bacterium]|nr:MAG: hypothetical protein UR14_C0003G0086 [candidate division TM6 bacterium GW2011_GWE2_31_21]KKP53750.1 MAG: hypothetical protein UR43_C0003G0071 [candidate division TM6 bacterium GW2011_GWF2_33_332]HBS48496.1 hypothetical protein [Candidatus Dependentiae bacterium]HBZ73111.1 hypothetical protein [Candidatus Dependentiae bacterium]